MKAKITFRIPASVAQEFKAACRRRGILQQDAGLRALTEWTHPSQPLPQSAAEEMPGRAETVVVFIVVALFSAAIGFAFACVP